MRLGDASGLDPLRKAQYCSLAGEFLVLAELALRGFDATPTLSRTKGIDILVHNPITRRPFQLEVKTTTKGPEREKPFGHNYAWMIGRAVETLSDPDLIYAFVLVALPPTRVPPVFFLVPSRYVAEYVAWSHERHLEAVRQPRNPQSPMRKFRIPAGSPEPREVPQSWESRPWVSWRENWSILGRQARNSACSKRTHPNMSRNDL
jgi:hypothetical protein